ncbi:MAG TPA: hypothetical protein VGL62_13635 [Vicinamibacterales bacterium]|jgi:hypothetical protein
MLAWTFAAVGVVLAIGAWMRAGRIARKLEALNQSYWELRYDFTRLRAQLARLDPETESHDEPPAQAPAGQTVAFVPLSSIRKKE